MDSADFRLRDHQDGCTGTTTVHRAEVRGRPGRLVRLTRLTGDAAGGRTGDLVDTWRTIPHTSLLPITSSHRDTSGLVLIGPMASARPLDHLEAASAHLSIATLSHVGRSIAAGLEALHAHGVCHGMVDGHTILLGSDGTAVLDGPWHPACRPLSRACGDRAAPDRTDGAATEAGDVRALAVTLVHHLDGVERERACAAGDRLRVLLERQRDQPGGAAAFEAALASWQRATPSTGAERGAALLVDPPPSPVSDEHADRSTGRWRGLPVLATAVIAGGLALGLALGIAGETTRAGSNPAGAVEAPSDGPTSEAVPTVDGAAGTGPAEAPSRSGPIEVANRPVCPDTIAPPGPGRLLLGDLDGRGCRAAVRVDGPRLALISGDGRPIEVMLDLEDGDQVRVGDLDGSERDEVLVYRPASGELFRFGGLADPGDERAATGETTPWRGGTAVLVPSPEGPDQLEVRGGVPG